LKKKNLGTEASETTNHVQEPFSFCSSVTNGIGCEKRLENTGNALGIIHLLPEHPVLIIPPIVATGAGSILEDFSEKIKKREETYRREQQNTLFLESFVDTQFRVGI
jgi:hypothetical protein